MASFLVQFLWIASCVSAWGLCARSPVRRKGRGFTRWTLLNSNVSSSSYTTRGTYSLLQTHRHFSSTRDDDATAVVDDCLEEEDDTTPRSAFGTKEYWDDTYEGRGDFPADEYAWYYGWDVLRPLLEKTAHVKDLLAQRDSVTIFLPGIGNDPLLLDLVQSGYTRLYAQDYSQAAVDRQHDLLQGCSSTTSVELTCGDIRRLPQRYHDKFDLVLEKGLLDAVYLSSNEDDDDDSSGSGSHGPLCAAVASLTSAVRTGGIVVSVSGVVPHDLRRAVFTDDEWTWVRDGKDDLQAGCFVLQKRGK